MGAVGVLPDGDPPVRTETLHESGRTRVTRLFLAGRTVIRKEPLGPDAVGRLEHERAMLERLRGVDGVAQVVDAPRYPDSIVLADVGGTSMAALVKPLAVDDLIRLAVALARAVAGMHRRGVMHRDITPANVVLSGDGVPCLVDFALAASVAEMRPEFTHHRELVGTLAYLAPEQTGRTGRPVDQRADLYALGATLYELATGEPPFGTGDPLRLTHDHLARVPVASGAAEPGATGAAVGDPAASVGEGTGPPLPDRARAWSTTCSGCGTATHVEELLRSESASVIFRLACCRRPGSWDARTRSRRCGWRLSRRCWAGAGGCWSAGRREWANGAVQRAAADGHWWGWLVRGRQV